MKLDGAVAVVTGAASGIGAALSARFAAEGADVVGVDKVAAPGVRVCDVTDASAVRELVDAVVAEHGRVDLVCSNAGMTTGVGIDADPEDLWHRAYELNVLAHVHAARAALPHMLARGRGYLLNTASAAGLLTSPGDAVYAVTKHAAVGLAEWLAVSYGERGIGVSVLCPMGVATPLLMEPLAAGEPGALAVAASGAIVSADVVADAAVAGLADERFLILPHPEVARYYAQKAADPDRWLAGMRRLAAGQ